MRTLFKVASIAPYPNPTRNEIIDPLVHEFVSTFRPDILNYLKDYSRSIYDADIHIRNLFYFDKPIADEHLYSDRIKKDPLMLKARRLAENALRSAFTVNAISAHNFDSVPYVKTSSAGYGYTGTKRDNYLLARRYTVISLF